MARLAEYPKVLKRVLSKSPDDWKRIGFSLFKDIKYGFRPSDRKIVAFIVGCQRSGSTMLYRIFTKDYRSKVYHEFDKLNRFDVEKGIRIKPLPELKTTLQSVPHPLVVAKPLVESQNIGQLLASHKQAKCIWLYRHYQDVARSNLQKFGPNNGKYNLIPVLNQLEKNWRSENIDEDTYRTLRSFSLDKISQLDAAALFWWVRNRHYLRQNLQNNRMVYTCNYINLVSQPREEMRKIYSFLELKYPGDQIVSHVHQKSIGRGKDIKLNNEINDLCQALLKQLDQFAN